MIFRLSHLFQSPRRRAIRAHLDQITRDVFSVRAVPETIMQVAIILQMRMEKQGMPLSESEACRYTKRYLSNRDPSVVEKRLERIERTMLVAVLLLWLCYLALCLPDPPPMKHHYTCYGSRQIEPCTYIPGIDGGP